MSNNVSTKRDPRIHPRTARKMKGSRTARRRGTKVARG